MSGIHREAQSDVLQSQPQMAGVGFIRAKNTRRQCAFNHTRSSVKSEWLHVTGWIDKNAENSA